MQTQFNFDGPTLALAGQRLALDHANAVIEDWGDRAYKMLETYVQCYGSTAFKAEDFRNYSEIMGLPTPPSKRAFGFLFPKAKRNGIIKQIGVGPVKDPGSHCANAGTWISALVAPTPTR